MFDSTVQGLITLAIIVLASLVVTLGALWLGLWQRTKRTPKVLGRLRTLALGMAVFALVLGLFDVIFFHRFDPILAMVPILIVSAFYSDKPKSIRKRKAK